MYNIIYTYDIALCFKSA